MLAFVASVDVPPQGGGPTPHDVLRDPGPLRAHGQLVAETGEQVGQLDVARLGGRSHRQGGHRSIPLVRPTISPSSPRESRGLAVSAT